MAEGNINVGEYGEVIEKKKDMVTVRLARKEACAKCGACANGATGKEMLINAKNLCDATVGDTVCVVLDNADFIKATLIMYGLPFCAFLIGVFSGFFLGKAIAENFAEVIGFALGIILVTLVYLWIKSMEPHWKKGNYVPKAVSKK